MARRAGKAASRRSRQRRAKRATQLPSAAGARSAEAEPAAPAEEVREEARRPSGATPSAPSPARAYAGGGSTLTARERAEYHYVERDLRNIGVLTAILLALLLAAWFAFNALGLIG
jgi:Tfp pilus assembly protein FimV